MSNLFCASNLETIYQDGVLFLDTRAAQDYANLHPKDSYNCPFHMENWAQDLKQSLPPDIQRLAVFSANKDVAHDVETALNQVGISVVAHFDQGMDGWQNLGLPVEKVPTVSPSEIAKSDDYTILDVREDHEREREGHIPGSHHVPLQSLADNMSSFRPDEKYAVICHSGNRSAAAVKRLRRHGYQAHSILGGIREWKNMQLPVTR